MANDVVGIQGKNAARVHTFTAYHAAYVALAEELNAPLLTRDVRLAKAKQHRARIETV